MHGMETHAGVSAVRMVVPVVVIGKVFHRFHAVTQKVSLARIIEVVVRHGRITGRFDVQRTVALDFIAAAVFTVEEIVVVNPDILVVHLKRYAVVGEHHKAKIADFYIVV